MPEGLFLTFIAYMFTLGYCVPAVVIGFCYMSLLCFVRKRFENRKRMSGNRESRRMLDCDQKESREIDDPIRTLTNSVLRVVIFYYLCWTPFWACVLIPLINSDHLDSTFVLIQLFINTLPYVNACGNWILYAALNRQLREKTVGGRATAGRILVANTQATLATASPLHTGIMAIGQRNDSPNGSIREDFATDTF